MEQSILHLTETEDHVEAILEEVQNAPESLEKLLTRYCGKVMHPNHFLMVAAKRYLLYQLHVTDPQRVRLAQDILPVFDVLCKG